MYSSRQLFKLRVRVMMPVLIVRDDMVVCVGMRDGMRMRRAVVRVGEGVRMHVNVISHERVDYHENRTNYHYGKGKKVGPCQFFFKEHERQSCSDERRDGVIRARFRRTQGVLRTDVEKYRKPVGNEAEEQREDDINELRDCFTLYQRDDQRAEAGEYALQHHNFICALRGDLPRAIVFKAPANRCRNDKKRCVGKSEALRSLKREQYA